MYVVTGSDPLCLPRAAPKVTTTTTTTCCTLCVWFRWNWNTRAPQVIKSGTFTKKNRKLAFTRPPPYSELGMYVHARTTNRCYWCFVCRPRTISSPLWLRSSSQRGAARSLISFPASHGVGGAASCSAAVTSATGVARRLTSRLSSTPFVGNQQRARAQRSVAADWADST